MTRSAPIGVEGNGYNSPQWNGVGWIGPDLGHLLEANPTFRYPP
jgi:hypothetical protein